jgi:hypothetical protein
VLDEAPAPWVCVRASVPDYLIVHTVYVTVSPRFFSEGRQPEYLITDLRLKCLNQVLLITE